MSIFNYFKTAQKCNDFGIAISDADWETDWASLASKQTTAIDINLVKRHLTLHWRQTHNGVIQEILFHILEKDYKKIDHICVTPSTAKSYEYHFRDGVVVDHLVKFDYEDNYEVRHIITMEFKEIEFKTPPNKQRKSIVLKSSLA